MSRFKVVILDNRFDSYEEERRVLAGLGAEITGTWHTAEEAGAAALAEADGILLNLPPMTAATIAGLANCRVISRYGVGFDNVDLEAATRAGIWVANVRDYAEEDVSDHALALLLACVRRVPARDRRVRKGEWNTAAALKSRRIKGKTLGLVGYGVIGKALHRKVAGLGLASVLINDPFIEEAVIRKAGGEKVGLEELLRRSDLVSIHAPLNEETRGLIGARALDLMKEDAILVNTARGPLVDTEALVEAIRGRKIGCAGLDVHESEPLPADTPLKDLEDVILTDHVAWYTEESIVELKTLAAENVAAALRGERPRFALNEVGSA